MSRSIRAARRADAAAMAAIYAPIVATSTTSFELVPPTTEEFAQRVAATMERLPWLVFDEDGEVLGYAYAGVFRARPAYRWTVETSVYVRADRVGLGLGRALMLALLDGVQRLGYRRAVAGVTLPNDPSVRLHEALGFQHAGTFHRCGHKFGAWHDVGFWERALAPGPGDGQEDSATPEEPRPLAALWADAGWAAACAAVLGR